MENKTNDAVQSTGLAVTRGSAFLAGRRGAWFWDHKTCGKYSWGSFKTKKEARTKMDEYLKSF